MESMKNMNEYCATTSSIKLKIIGNEKMEKLC